MMWAASAGLKSCSMGTITVPYVSEAMNTHIQVEVFLPSRATLSPGFRPAASKKRCRRAIRRATSVYVMVLPEP